MPPTNLIVNGDFNNNSAGWNGTDIEANYTENAYLYNGSSNHVAELDGHSGQTTVMQQSFTVTNPMATELTFDSALRTASNGQAGQEGFTVEILDANGVVIASMTVLPTLNSFTNFSLPVTFTSPGTYTVRLTEVGPDNSIGAIVDNISLMTCFVGGTQIETPDGLKPIEEIRVGDLVQTQNGPQPVCWVGRREVSLTEMAKNPKLHPVRITAGALGAGLPRKDLLVSRQHRMLVETPAAKKMFGQNQVLLAAIKLCRLPGIYVDDTVQQTTYFHLLFEKHQIVFANGAPSESLYTGAQALKALPPEAREEILTLFPELATHKPMPAKTIPQDREQKKLVDMLSKTGAPLLENHSSPL